MPGEPSTKRAFHNSGRWLMVAFVSFMIVCAVVDIVNAFSYSLQHNDARLPTYIMGVVFLIAISYPLSRGSFAAVIVEASGVKVRNPWHTRFFRWSEIQGFTLHQPQLGPSYGRIELQDGKHYHIFGITTGNMPRWERESRQMIAELNKMLDRQGDHQRSVDREVHAANETLVQAPSVWE